MRRAEASIRSVIVLAFAALVLIGPGRAFASTGPWLDFEGHRVRLISTHETAPPDGEMHFGVEYELEDGWIVYWINPGDLGFAPTFDLSATVGIADQKTIFPAPERHVEVGEQIAFGWTKHVVYPLRATIEAGDSASLEVEADINYLACKEKCIPIRGTLVLDQKVGAKPVIDKDSFGKINVWLQKEPSPQETIPGLIVEAAVWSEGPVLTVKIVGGGNDPRGMDLFPEPSDAFYFTPLKDQVAAPDGMGVRFTIPLMPAGEGPLPDSTPLQLVATGLKTPLGEASARIETEAALKNGAPPALAETVAAGSAPHGPGTSLPLILLLGFLGGMILNVMPCVLPVVSLKVFTVIQSAGKGRGAVISSNLATAFGILVSFWTLAALAIVARNAGLAVGWGVQFQEPAFVAFLAVVVLLFAMNMWGVFEIPMPQWAGRLGTKGASEGLAGHFFTGLFATLLATPCSAPFLGTAVGFGLSQSALVIAAVFTALGLGMAFPYLLLAAFPKAANRFPHPGTWMEKVRIAMGFPLAATVVWLAYVLAGQISAAGLAWIQLSLVVGAMLVWLTTLARGKKALRTVLILATLASLAVPVGLAARYKGTSLTKEHVGGVIEWQPFSEQTLTAHLAEGRIVLVNFTADWCFTCKFLERSVLESPEVVAALDDRSVVPLRGDWTNRDDDIAAYMASFGRYGVPFNALFFPGKAPVVLPEAFTTGAFLDALNR